MYLSSLTLRHFRNYCEQHVDFTAPKVILVGQNAQGKSNLLESIELLSMLRSHRTSRDRDLIRDDEPTAQISATLQRLSGSLDLKLILRSNGRRTVAVNSETVRRHLDFLGHLNAVQFSTLDLDIVRGGPAERRQWLDTVLVQLEPLAAYVLQQYQHTLKQRNALLKQHRAQDPPLDWQQLELWNQQLALAGVRVIERRRRLLARLAPLAAHWHSRISGHHEELELVYLPNVEPEPQSPEALRSHFLAQLQAKATAEQHQGQTLVGPHRDEVGMTLNHTPARQYGSQGQQRTLVLALKLAELTLIDEVVGDPPLLLLDDVLAELDLNRQNQLLEAIQERFQTFITTTHLGAFDASWLRASQILTVDAGHLVEPSS